jgi:uncharacterized protein (UPF0276 family)
VGFFEVHAENYMGDGGAPLAMLERLRADYPIFLHGVAMSIGGEARWTVNTSRASSGWCGVTSRRWYRNTLPGPRMTPPSTTTFARALHPRRAGQGGEHIDEVQHTLGRTMLLENPSTYVAFNDCEMGEIDFIREVARRTGCGLLLDVNNVFVSATNHGFSPERYLADFPLHLVREIHLAGMPRKPTTKASRC